MQVLHLLVKLYGNLQEPDYISSSQCFVYLNDSAKCAELLSDLCKKDDYHRLIAYQIAFDLEANTTQEFLKNVIALLPSPSTPVVSIKPPSAPVSDVPAAEDPMETDESTPLVKPETETKVDTTSAVEPSEPLSPLDDGLTKIHKILSGSQSIKLYLEFLSRANHADLLILKKTKESLETRSAVYHSAITVANAYMNAGTTSDEFLRQNLEWLAKATNWTKFGATAALGVIHKVFIFFHAI